LYLIALSVFEFCKSKYIKNDKKRNADLSTGCSKSNGTGIIVFTYLVVKRFVSTARRSGQYEKNIIGLAIKTSYENHT
jgi:hypothetical protein